MNGTQHVAVRPRPPNNHALFECLRIVQDLEAAATVGERPYTAQCQGDDAEKEGHERVSRCLDCMGESFGFGLWLENSDIFCASVALPPMSA